jgi:hypothetical protein
MTEKASKEAVRVEAAGDKEKEKEKEKDKEKEKPKGGEELKAGREAKKEGVTAPTMVQPQLVRRKSARMNRRRGRSLTAVRVPCISLMDAMGTFTATPTSQRRTWGRAGPWAATTRYGGG